MALIKTAYNLAGGTTRSSVITGGTYLHVQAFLTTTTGRVSYFVEKRNSDTGDWLSVIDPETNKPIVFHTNGTTEGGVSVALAGGDIEYSVNVVTVGATGTLNLDAVTDGTIA
jgi:hypothetical protein